MRKVVFITGAGRGMGVDIARAALDARHQVVATGRRPDAVRDAVGEHDDLLTLALDITDPVAATTAVAAAVEHFGRIDVVINNAATFQAGYFEEISDERFRAQIETNLFGPLNVTRAVLPVMRAQRSGHIVTITSLAGIVGQDYCVAYSTSKFGLEGWMEALRFDVEPFGISTTIVEPGFFRTHLLEESSTQWADLTVDDYAERSSQTQAAWQGMNGQQPGDPAKLASALITVIDRADPPTRWVAGADAVAAVERKAREILTQAVAEPELSTTLDHA